MKKKLAAVLAALLCMAGCSGVKEQADIVNGQEEDKIQIGISFDSFVVERWQRDRDVFVSSAVDLGAEVTVQNANGDIEEQVAQLEYFIEKKVDVIVVVPIESEALHTSIEKARNAGIKVISYDRLVLGTEVDLYISFDNEAVGRLMGQAVMETLEEGDRILMLCGPGSDHNVSMVECGFREVVEQSSLDIVDTYYVDGWKAEYAAEYMEAHEEALQDIDAIMCGNDNIAAHVIRVLAEQRLAGDICVVAQDADLAACQRIVEGTQYMTVYKPVEKLAAQAADEAVKLAGGETIDTEDFMEDEEYRIPYIKLEPIAVTKENMDEVIIGNDFHQAEDVYLNRPDLRK